MNSTEHHNINKVKSRFTNGIRGRLFIGFGIIAFILIVSMVLILYKITVTEYSSRQVIKVDLPTHDALYDLSLQIYATRLALNNWVMSSDPKYKDRFYQAWKIVDKKIAVIENYSKFWDKSDHINKWSDVKTLLYQLKEVQFKFAQSATPSKDALYKDVLPYFDKLFLVIDGSYNQDGKHRGGILEKQYNLLNKGADNIIISMNHIAIIEYVLFFICMTTLFLVAMFTTRGIVRYINTFRLHSAKIASGDLRDRINVVSTDELGQLGRDLNTMTDSLARITKQITETCHSMVTTIEEVRRAVDVQSTGATEQASSINQITASLEEIEKSSSQTIDKAKALGEVAERTRNKGQLGLKSVENSVIGMKAVREKVQIIAQTILDLSTHTQQVGEITSLVNTLAQQSKMLALNASIEAAKAGEAGKGFAVVASEVKNLAEQSEQSTTQVQKILEDIRRATERAVMATEEGTKGVDQGTSLVEQTGDIVRKLSDVIHETAIASQQIEAAIRQEGVGIEQITAGMNEINQVTASFVASVKQTTEAIESLAEMVKNLKQYTDVYKL